MIARSENSIQRLQRGSIYQLISEPQSEPGGEVRGAGNFDEAAAKDRRGEPVLLARPTVAVMQLHGTSDVHRATRRGFGSREARIAACLACRAGKFSRPAKSCKA